MWKARIVDPTGAFTVYAGQYQSDASIFFSTVQVPAFIALTGKARIYEPEPGSIFVSIRAEEANVVDEEIRNRWVVDTAEQTVDRLEAFSDALAQLRVSIREGLRALNFESEGPAGAKTDQKEFVLELLREVGGGKGVDYATFVDAAVSRGVPEELVEEVVRSLLAGGQCYEPKIGIIRLVG